MAFKPRHHLSYIQTWLQPKMRISLRPFYFLKMEAYIEIFPLLLKIMFLLIFGERKEGEK